MLAPRGWQEDLGTHTTTPPVRTRHDRDSNRPDADETRGHRDRVGPMMVAG